MRVALFVALATLTGATPRFHRVNERTPQGRSTRGLMSDSLAFFEAFPASGAGTTTACSTTAPTGARGESLTFSRASSATCTRTATGGLALTGIADGDLVSLGSGVARVEWDSASTLGLLVEAQGINLLPRYNDLTNAAWSDVGTPTVTDGATDPFGGTTGDTIDDNDGAAYEGRSQPITVSAGAAHIAYCYVKAGSLTAARITLDGTATNITGLSATTWSIVQVADASSSGVSIVVQVLAGSATSDTGTVIFGGCDAKTGATLTSIVPTVAASATRVAESPRFPLADGLAFGSLAATIITPAVSVTGNRQILMARVDGSNFWEPYIATTTAQVTAFTYVAAGVDTFLATGALSANTSARVVQYRDPTPLLATVVNGTTTSNGTGVGAIITTAGGTGLLYIGADSSAGTEFNGIISRVCLDPSPERCR